MKVYIFKDASGEYGSYEENVREVYLVDDSVPGLSELEAQWNKFIIEEKKKAKATSVRWTKKYIQKSGFLFEDWFKKNYNCTPITFSEHIDYE